jgi:hypothetical protein
LKSLHFLTYRIDDGFSVALDVGEHARQFEFGWRFSRCFRIGIPWGKPIFPPSTGLARRKNLPVKTGLKGGGGRIVIDDVSV